MTQEFNRQKLFENVSAIIQDRGLKIGDVESAVGISAGYLSRLSKKDSDASISVDLVCKLSHFFGVSVDALLEGDFSIATNNTKYFESFLKRLRQSVENNQEEWDTISSDDVDEALMGMGKELPIVVELNDSCRIAGKKYGISFFDEDEEKLNAAKEDISKDWVAGRHWQCSGRRLYSYYYPDDKAWVSGLGFRYVLDEDTSMYLFKLMFETVDSMSSKNEKGVFNTSLFWGYEILFEKRELSEDYDGSYEPGPDDYVYKTYPICNTTTNGTNLSGTVDLLYCTTVRHAKDLRIDKTVRTSIDSYMEGTDGVPF